MGGKSHLKLNNSERPIANKYREGKIKRTLKRELKVLEIAKREAVGPSIGPAVFCGSVSASVCSVRTRAWGGNVALLRRDPAS